jgi:DNA-binding CsgD family transcriptional regulator
VHDWGAAIRNIAAEWIREDYCPAIIVNSARQVRWANAAAERQLRSPQALYLSGGTLSLADQRNVESFDEALARVESSREKIPVTDRAGRVAIIVTASAHDLEDQRALLLAIKIVSAPLSIATASMARTFALTPAEVQILDRLTRLEPPAAIAKTLSISVHTVRTHVRNLYNKTSVNSDLELLRLAFAFAG